MTSTNEIGLEPDRIQNQSGAVLDDLQCWICHNTMWKPVSCRACKKHFCSTCIKRWLREGINECPIRCKPFIEGTCSETIITQLSRLQISCIYAPNSCCEVSCSTSEMICSTSCFRFFHTKRSKNMRQNVVTNPDNVLVVICHLLKRKSRNMNLSVNWLNLPANIAKLSTSDVMQVKDIPIWCVLKNNFDSISINHKSKLRRWRKNWRNSVMVTTSSL
jgi:hypothetical protein